MALDYFQNRNIGVKNGLEYHLTDKGVVKKLKT
jgi:hypothetical protein